MPSSRRIASYSKASRTTVLSTPRSPSTKKSSRAAAARARKRRNARLPTARSTSYARATKTWFRASSRRRSRESLGLGSVPHETERAAPLRFQNVRRADDAFVRTRHHRGRRTERVWEVESRRRDSLGARRTEPQEPAHGQDRGRDLRR